MESVEGTLTLERNNVATSIEGKLAIKQSLQQSAHATRTADHETAEIHEVHHSRNLATAKMMGQHIMCSQRQTNKQTRHCANINHRLIRRILSSHNQNVAVR